MKITQRLESEKQSIIDTKCGVIDMNLIDDMIVFSVVLRYFEGIALIIVYDVIGCILWLHLSQIR